MTTPPTDPLVRKEPPLDWYRTPSEAGPRVETADRLPDLDPDIALWPVTPMQRWPFTGAPSVGIWPKGWTGVDNTGTTWVCTVGGQPGTWAQVGGGGTSGQVNTVVAGANVTVDDTDPVNPVVAAPDGVVASVVAGTNVTVDDTDPHNPIVSAAGGGAPINNWAYIQSVVPPPLTAGTPSYSFVLSDLSISLQHGSDLSLANVAGTPALVSATGGLFVAGIAFDGISGETLDGSSTALRYVDLTLLCGDVTFQNQLSAPVPVPAPAFWQLAFSCPPGRVAPGGTVLSVMQLAGRGLVGTDSIPLDGLLLQFGQAIVAAQIGP